MNSHEGHSQTPLDLAAFNGRADTARRRVLHRADISARDSLGQTPFSVALKVGNRKVARLLSDWETMGKIVLEVCFLFHAILTANPTDPS